MTGRIISHPTLARDQIVESLTKTPSPGSLFTAYVEFRASSWDVAPLTEIIRKLKWHRSDESAKQLADFLRLFSIDFIAPPDEPNDVAQEIDPRAREFASVIMATIKEDRSRPERFWRARRMRGLVSDSLGAHDPLPVIERHLALFFDPAKRPSTSPRFSVKSDSSDYGFLRNLVDSYARSATVAAEVRAMQYFVSDPYRDKDLFSLAEVHDFCKLRPPFIDLAFTRFTFPLEDRLNPMPVEWSDVTWLFRVAQTPYQMNRLVLAMFELREELEYMPASEVTDPINDFFLRVTTTQDQHGGVSLWDEETATHSVYWLYNFTCLSSVRTDFPSWLCGLGRDVLEPDWPKFDEWARLVHAASDLGYVELAQALTAYKLLDEALFADGITNWPALVFLLRETQSQPGSEMTARAARMGVEALTLKGYPALAARLEAYAAPTVLRSSNVVKFIVEGTKRPKAREEIAARLIEHVGGGNWAKFQDKTRDWLIEADLNWANWRFAADDQIQRKDWSAPALQFCKAVEHELVDSYRDLCLEAGDHDKSGRVTLGSVMMFFTRARKGDATRMRLLHESGRELPSASLVKSLDTLVNSYRNLAAHPYDFDQDRLDRLRRSLLTDRVLRDIAEQLLPTRP